LDERATDRHLERKEVILAQLCAICGNRVDFPRLVSAMNESLGPAPTASCTDKNNITAPHSPLALDAKQLRSQVENQVVPFVAERQEDAESALHGLPSNRLFRDHTLLISRQHRQQR